MRTTEQTCDARIGGASTACAGHTTEVWHGMTTPALVCDKHVQEGGQYPYVGHRARLDATR